MNITPLYASLEFSKTSLSSIFHLFLPSFRSALKKSHPPLLEILISKAAEHWDTWMQSVWWWAWLTESYTPRAFSPVLLGSSHMQYLAVKLDLLATSVYTAGKAGTSVSRWQLTTSLCCPNGNWISTTIGIGTILLRVLENYVRK